MRKMQTLNEFQIRDPKNLHSRHSQTTTCSHSVVFALHFTNFALDLTPIEAHDVYMKFILNRKWKKADETDYERKTRFTKFVQTYVLVGESLYGSRHWVY